MRHISNTVLSPLIVLLIFAASFSATQEAVYAQSRTAPKACLSANASGDFDLTGIPDITPWLSRREGFLGEMVNNHIAAWWLGLSRAFDVSPSMAYYDDRGLPNAFATSVPTYGYSDGSIRMGVNLVSSELRYFRSNPQGRAAPLAIGAIMAHEMAHILQFKKGVATPGRNTELQADFLAGWYFARFRVEDIDYFDSRSVLRDGLNAFFSRGDYAFNSPEHHGTPQQRLAAFEAGYLLGPKDLRRAWEESMRYRKRLGG